MAELFQQLESNDSQAVDDAKQRFHEQFNIVQDAWLLNGLFDYYIATNSPRCAEVIVNTREPHYHFLFNKLCHALANGKTETRIQALTLLGHVLRKQPPWVYKITEHQCLKELLRLLKSETDDILLLLSALLVLIVLLPIVPSRVGDHLTDIFEIFSRLAAWNCSTPLKLMEEQLIHLQVALYALFQRLYGMYPCNFVAFLRNHYRSKELLPVFLHTIKPMLDSVKMHSLLVTASKERETTTERWKHMESHDVVVECERLSIGLGDRCPHDSCYYVTSTFRSRSGTTNSATYEGSYQLYSLNSVTPGLLLDSKEFFSPSMASVTAPTPIPTTPHSHVVVESTSPPETAIEATPETTPIKDPRPLAKIQLPTGSTAARALNNLGRKSSGNSTPNHSQPSSPMRKEPSLFSFGGSEHPRASAFVRKDSNVIVQKVQRLLQDRGQEEHSSVRASTPHLVHPTSPLRIVPPSDGMSFVPRIESPVSQEDEEVLEIVRMGGNRGEGLRRQCDSVLQEGDGTRGTDDEDLDDCEQEHGSPCAEGGLHMPNSRSMSDFAKRVRRLRYHSQSSGGIEHSSQPGVATGDSSPGKSSLPFASHAVRRTSSCPDMKKPTIKRGNERSKTLDETDEEKATATCCKQTQTDNFWPMPYEHLFLGVFPSLECADSKPSPAPSPAPVFFDRLPSVSPYEILDKYMDRTMQSAAAGDASKSVREQLELLQQQLLFEKHRRETHALKNRRLLADAKNIKTCEEHNSALRDQVQLKQREVDNLKDQLRSLKMAHHLSNAHSTQSASVRESQYVQLQHDHSALRDQRDELARELDRVRTESVGLDAKRRRAEADLLDATVEAKLAKEQAWAGERGRGQLETLHKEVFVMGEVQKRCKEKLGELAAMGRSEHELALATEAYNHELRGLRATLDHKTAALEACKTRLSELEQAVNERDESATRQKRFCNEIKDECDAKVKTLESKYKTQLKINVALEERILELYQRSVPVNSPDTSSCHEVVPTSLASPLSVSLGSSEGHGDLRTLQCFAEQGSNAKQPDDFDPSL